MKRATVIGAGLVGLSTANALAKRGYAVVVHERLDPFHDRGISHGRSRIVRRAYTDRRFTDAMMEAYPMWADLEAELGERLVREVGLVYFGSAQSPDLIAMARDLADLGVTHEARVGRDVALRFPALRLSADEVGIWTPEAGWVDAEATLRGLHRLAVGRGVEFRFGSKASLAEIDGPVAICAGPWIREFVDADVRVTMQTFAYVDAEIDGPVWIEDSASLPYGFPSDEWGLKLALHSYGPEIDPMADRPTLPVEVLRDVVRRRFGVEDPVVNRTGTCLYTNTVDEGFLFGVVEGRAAWVSACSGHAFKFGPWLGRQMADRIDAITA